MIRSTILTTILILIVTVLGGCNQDANKPPQKLESKTYDLSEEHEEAYLQAEAAAKPKPPRSFIVPTADQLLEKAQGQLFGKPFNPDKASFEKGVLTIRQGKEFFADLELKIFTSIDGSLDNKTITVERNNRFSNPHIHAGQMKEGARAPAYKVFLSEYDMLLQFGVEKDFKIPLTISLQLPDRDNSYLVGRIDVATSGLVAKDGVIDLTHDDLATIKYVGQRYLSELVKDDDISFITDRGIIMEHHSDEPSHIQFAQYAPIYSINGGPRTLSKLMLTKGDEGWVVSKLLENNQSFAAHPVNKDAYLRFPAGAALPLAADMAEDLLRKMAPDELLNMGMQNITCSEVSGAFAAQCEVTYLVYDELENVRCKGLTYLYRKVHDAMVYGKTLPNDQMVDRKSGQIKDRDEDWPGSC